MTNEEKVALVESFYEVREDGNMDAVRGFLADGVVWHEPDTGSEHTGDLTGADSVVAMISAAQKKAAGAFILTPTQIVANGEHAVALVGWAATKNDAVIEGKEIAVFRIRGRRIVEVSFHQGDAGRDRGFWS